MEARNTSAGAGGGVARASLAGFVSTSVLTSSDGLFGDNVEEKRVTEAPAPRAEDAAGYKPLYEQLQELREKKDSEWKEKNNPFAPPKALDDEELEFIRDLEARKADSERKRSAQHDEDLAQFQLARSAPKTASSAGLTTQHLQKYPPKSDAKAASKNQASVVVVRAKRKATASKKDKPREAATKTAVPEVQPAKKQKTAKTAATTSSPAAGLGLVAYSSDSESGSDAEAASK